MTRVLKRNGATDALDVHSLMAARPSTEAVVAAPAIDPEIAALRAEVDALKQELEARDARLSELCAEADAAFRKGETKGHEAGLREAADQSEQRLARLEAGIGQAGAAVTTALEGLQRLAPVLAQEALASILGQADARPQLVAAVVSKQLETIEARALVHVEVSAADFPDDDALAALEGALGSLGPVVHASVSLKSGDCRIKLKLGTLEVGLDRQWAELSAMLRDMTEGSAS